MLSRRDIWHGIGACAVATAAFAPGARAQANYPDRPVRIILPYGPGGVADVSTRLVAAMLSERMGQNFFIDNRPGAGGIVADEFQDANRAAGLQVLRIFDGRIDLCRQNLL
jgi:tripartite-type tricarboxylate transporter receptor subunit TctC